MHLYAQSSAQQTLRLIRTKNVEYPSFLSLEAVDFFHCSLVGVLSTHCRRSKVVEGTGERLVEKKGQMRSCNDMSRWPIM
eukprot:scaffold124905_cov20-Tisochrysis_lutea.AAC.5